MNKYLYGWIFTPSLRDTWIATDRDHYHQIWNGDGDEFLIESKDIETLQTVIIKCHGDMELVKKWKEAFNGVA